MEVQWPLILFTTFIAWSAGVFGAQGLYALRGKGSLAQPLALGVSFGLMVVGGIAVFFHLQHWERIFNGFGHVTSGITQELIAIVALFAVMVVYFVILRRSGKNAEVPRWVAVLSIVVSAVLVVVMGHSYMMDSLPAWNSVLQVGSLIGAACALGASTMAFLSAVKEGGDVKYNGKVAVIGQVVNLVFVVAYIFALGFAGSELTQVAYWFDPVSPTKDIAAAFALSPFEGEALVFTLLAIAGALMGVASAFLGKTREEWKLWGAVGAVAVLIGTISLRVVFYLMGVSVYPFF